MAGPLRPPRALLLDLDDTILVESRGGDDPWREHLPELAAALGEAPERVMETLVRVRRWFWSDPERHRRGRLGMDAARREVAAEAVRALGRTDAAARAAARRYADAVIATRDARLRPCPGALETLADFRTRGLPLALLTNGGAPLQRAKIERFALAGHFEAVLIEGELGFGKPDPRVFERALAAVGAAPEEAWMIGNDLRFDVAGARAAGVGAVWIDHAGEGVPDDAAARPHRTVRALAEVPALLG